MRDSDIDTLSANGAQEAWQPASAEVRLLRDSPFLDGEEWPEQVELVAWERNDSGERRIKGRRRYRVAEDVAQ